MFLGTMEYVHTSIGVPGILDGQIEDMQHAGGDYDLNNFFLLNKMFQTLLVFCSVLSLRGCRQVACARARNNLQAADKKAN